MGRDESVQPRRNNATHAACQAQPMQQKTPGNSPRERKRRQAAASRVATQRRELQKQGVTINSRDSVERKYSTDPDKENWGGITTFDRFSC